jgi:hypothetical protein
MGVIEREELWAILAAVDIDVAMLRRAEDVSLTGQRAFTDDAAHVHTVRLNDLLFHCDLKCRSHASMTAPRPRRMRKRRGQPRAPDGPIFLSLLGSVITL